MLAGPEDRPQLGAERALVVEDQPNRATAELGILLGLEPDVGDPLVSAEIEGES